MAVTDPPTLTRTDGSPKWNMAGAVAAAAGASVCCVGPLLLLALGVGGAWIGNLTAMERYRPIWMAAALVFLGLAFVRAYRKPKEEVCTPGTTCPPDAGRGNKVLLWIVTALVLGLLALPYVIPYAFAGVPAEGPVPRQVGPERLTEATTQVGFPSKVMKEGGKQR